MNRTAKIVSVVLILILAGLVILSVRKNLWFSQGADQQKNEKTSDNWLTFQNDTFDFTFKYPPKAIWDISDPAMADEPKRVRVRLIGPESVPKTEITDGFTFYVRSGSLHKQETFAEAANRIFKAETERREIINELAKSEINGWKEYIFSVRSELGGEVTYSIFEGKDDTIFITNSIISTPKGLNRSYTEMIKRMQISLKKQN